MKQDTSGALHAETRRLAAIMFTDIAGFSRQMGSDEARMLRLLEVHNQLIQQAVNEHHGSVIKTVGDAFLVDFPSVVHAVQCAQQIQAQFRAHNAGKESAEQIHVRIGIHLGDIVQKDGDVFGDGVNIAARLQELAAPDTVCISHKVYEEVAKKLDLGMVVSLGRPKLKNIAERLTVYALLLESPKGLWRVLQVQQLKLKQWRRPLRGAVMLLVLGLVSGGAIVLRDRYFPASPALPLPDKPSIVVLPFINMSNDPEQEYFSDGFTEDLTTDLSKVSGLFVIARNSAFTYKGKAVNVGKVSQQLGVRHVLEGSVRKADSQVRITAQLIDATTGGHIWSERYDRPLQEIFALQDEIRQKIVTALKVQLTPEEQERLKHAPTDNLEAYDYLLRGWADYQRFTKEAHAQARQMFEKAIELDSQYAAAYASLGGSYWWAWAVQWSQDPQSLAQAFALAQKAVTLNDALPLAHVILGHAYQWKKQHEQAIVEAERAITLDPNCAACYAELGQILNLAGRPAEAIEVIEKAMRLDPQTAVRYASYLGRAYRLTGRYEEAIVAFKKILSVNPNLLGPHAELAVIYNELGHEQEARAEAAEILRISPNFSVEGWKQRAPQKDPEKLERYLAALRQAGLK
jgi:TolB-like protein/class 3 adenylate cyclase/Flp pilus assembly protein TadD